MKILLGIIFAVVLLVSVSAVAQTVPGRATKVQEPVEYRLGAHDQVQVSVFGSPDLSPLTPVEVDSSGMISLPYAGAVKAAGKTGRELERDVETALKERHVKDPHVTVQIRERSSEPVSVLGAVRAPQVYQMDRQWSLFDLISKAGGFTETVGRTIQVRRASDGAVTTIQVQDLEFLKPEANIPIYPNDSISVSTAGWVVVGGEVAQPKEIILTRGRTITIREAIALAGNTTKDAKKKSAVLIRKKEGQPDEEIAVNLEKVMTGLDPNLPMADYDYLFVPPDKVKSGLNKVKDSAFAIAVGRLIYF